ncbi:MAG: hypothetical protein HY270_24760 [Deltaproteobacteria bacterium]|nr:hypothetical protein [Deltaproteobacteria bacterium]
MPSNPLRRRGAFTAGLKRDLIQRTAASVLVLRAIEGVSAGLFLARTMLGQTPGSENVIQGVGLALFLAYVGINLLCYWRYRNNDFPEGLVLADLGCNLGIMLIVCADTGGLASPVMLICFVNIALYGFVYSPLIGIAAVALTLGVVTISLGASEYLGIPSTLPNLLAGPGSTPFPQLFVVAGALIAAIWLFNQVAEKEQQTKIEANRAKRAAER